MTNAAPLDFDGSLEQSKPKLFTLETGPIYWFSDWPITAVPRSGAIVYTVWDRNDHFIYVGMAGRPGASATGSGPFGRLASHASGRRSGDQFCIYICDRLVLPRLHNRFSEIAAGQLSLDLLTREFIRAELGFRFITIADGTIALTSERKDPARGSGLRETILNPGHLAAAALDETDESFDPCVRVRAKVEALSLGCFIRRDAVSIALLLILAGNCTNSRTRLRKIYPTCAIDCV
jgi:hypothetical protein